MKTLAIVLVLALALPVLAGPCDSTGFEAHAAMSSDAPPDLWSIALVRFFYRVGDDLDGDGVFGPGEPVGPWRFYAERDCWDLDDDEDGIPDRRLCPSVSFPVGVLASRFVDLDVEREVELCTRFSNGLTDSVGCVPQYDDENGNGVRDLGETTVFCPPPYLRCLPFGCFAAR